jgi:hypothetical protein
VSDVLRGGATLLVALLLCAGCGSVSRTMTVSRPFLQASDLARFPAGSPARSGAELVRLLEYNDATGAVRYFTPAWRLTPESLARVLRGDTLRGLLALVGRKLDVTGVHQTGVRTTISARIADLQGGVAVVLTREHQAWKLARLRIGALRLPRP